MIQTFKVCNKPHSFMADCKSQHVKSHMYKLHLHNSDMNMGDFT